MAGFLLISCVDEPEAPKIEMSQNAQLEKVKSWFEKNKAKLKLPEKGSNFRTESQELILPFFEKEPDWDKFHHYYFPDGREVFEINLSNLEVPIFGDLLDSIPNIPLKELVIQNILFIKNPTTERFDPIIARYYPKEGDNILGFKEISYQAINEYWSGRLDLFTYDEHHYISFEFINGEIVNELKFSNQSQNAKKTSHLNSLVRCVSYQLPVTNCVTTTSGTVCSANYNDLVTVTSCSGSSSSPNFIYTYGGSDNYSGGVVIDPNGVSGTEYYVPDVPVPVTIILNNLDNACAKKIYSQLIKNAIVNASSSNPNIMDEVLSLLAEVADFDFVAYDTNLGNPDVSAETEKSYYLNEAGNHEVSITFNDQYLNEATRLSIARTILHESVHAFLLFQGFCTPTSDIYVGFNNYLISKGLSNSPVGHHEFMSQYVEAIANSLMQWDLMFGQGNIPLSYMKDIAWGGLTGYKDVNNNYIRYDSFIQYASNSNTVMNRIESNIYNEKKSNSNAQGTSCN